ncbi:MAG: pyridoxamine 5'-phosphate oxidase [Rhodospirillaceae bacterium]|nr:pyridoxamine 5'-phosphate oxidase [Rhodospirillaceae bacterium]MBT6140105.1 pyridoxamine 5'-phosphate oxidase [Rhodospirillaceae bacterium]
MFELNTDDPFTQFGVWFQEAEASEPDMANAMTLATADADGRPSARIVLLKDFDSSGFVFYTNCDSPKGQELTINPFASLNFYWKSSQRQVRIEGPIGRVSDQEADEYFATRPRGSQLGAWASRQSQPLASRQSLIDEVDRFDKEYGNSSVPRPPFWSGFRLMPLFVEFWQAGEFRLHDRFGFSRSAEGDAWATTRMYP